MLYDACRVSSIQDPSGYPREMLEDASDLALVQCGICKGILKEPLQVTCGHHFCGECFRHLLGNARREDALDGDSPNSVTTAPCPSCQAEGLETRLATQYVHPDKYIAKHISKLMARCVRPGCQWRGTFEDFARRHESECRSIATKGDEEFQRKRGSLDPGAFSAASKKKEINSWLNSSSFDQIYINDKDVKRKDGKKKLFVDINAKSENEREEEDDDDRATEKKMITKIKYIEEQLAFLKRKTDGVEPIISTLTNTLNQLVLQVQTTFQENRRMREDMETLTSRLTETQSQGLRRDAEIFHLKSKLTSSQPFSQNGVLLWRIDAFEERMIEAANGTRIFLLSPMFMSSPCGYAMQAKMYPRGDGLGKNKYISIFFIILKSPHDNVLKWPFKQKVKFMIMDQSGRGEHVVDAFRPDTSSSSFLQPREGANTPTGCPLFMPIELLETRKNAYVKDGALFVKVSIDLKGLEDF